PPRRRAPARDADVPLQVERLAAVGDRVPLGLQVDDAPVHDRDAAIGTDQLTRSVEDDATERLEGMDHLDDVEHPPLVDALALDDAVRPVLLAYRYHLPRAIPIESPMSQAADMAQKTHRYGPPRGSYFSRMPITSSRCSRGRSCAPSDGSARHRG